LPNDFVTNRKIMARDHAVTLCDLEPCCGGVGFGALLGSSYQLGPNIFPPHRA